MGQFRKEAVAESISDEVSIEGGLESQSLQKEFFNIPLPHKNSPLIAA